MGRHLTERVLDNNPVPADAAPVITGEIMRPTLSIVTPTPVEPPSGVLSVRTGQNWWDAQQRAALAQLGLDQAPAADLMIFLQQCQRTGLDPFAKQVYMIGRWDGRLKRKKWTIQTGIDGFRIIAERSRQYAGQTPMQWCGPDGVWKDVWLEATPPAAARVGIIRRDFREPLVAVALFREYAAKNKDHPEKYDGLWGSKPAHMLGKVAEALGLRRAFPNDMSGIYVDEEMAAADNPDETAVEPEEQAVDESTDQTPAADGDQPAVEFDWDAAITEAEAGKNPVEDLRSLWYAAKDARPDDGVLAEKIETAAQTAALSAARAAEQGS